MSQFNTTKSITTTPSQNNKLPDPLGPATSTLSSIINFFVGNDIGLILTLTGLLLAVGLGITVGVEVFLPKIRTQFLNTVVGFLAAIVFLFIAFRYSNKEGEVMGMPISFGMILYILAIGFIVIAFSG